MKKIILFVTLIFIGIFSSLGETVTFSNINVDLDCSTFTYTGGSDISITGAYGKFFLIAPLEEGDGNLDIDNLSYSIVSGLIFMDIVPEGVIYKCMSSSAVINVLFSVTAANVINGYYREIKFKYSISSYNGSFNTWKYPSGNAIVDDLIISGDDVACYSPNETFTVTGHPTSSTFSWSKRGA